MCIVVIHIWISYNTLLTAYSKALHCIYFFSSSHFGVNKMKQQKNHWLKAISYFCNENRKKNAIRCIKQWNLLKRIERMNKGERKRGPIWAHTKINEHSTTKYSTAHSTQLHIKTLNDKLKLHIIEYMRCFEYYLNV